MILHSISLKNFKRYRDTRIEFAEGLTGIIGKNGSGKSTVFEAILLALFGEIPFNKEYLRSSAAGPQEAVSVELDFEMSGKRYTATREFRGKQLAPGGSLRDGAGTLIASGQREVTAAVERILGVGRDAFTRSVFSGQKELGAISSATGGERRLLVRRMIGMDRIDDVQKLVRERRTELRATVEAQSSLLLPAQELEAMGAERQSLALRVEKLARGEEEAGGILKTAEHTLAGAKREFEIQDDLFRRFSAIDRDMAGVRASLEAGERRASELETELAVLEQQREKRESMAPLLAEYEEVKQRRAQMEESKAQYVRLRELQKSREKAGAELAGMRRAVAREKASLERLCDADRELEEALRAETLLQDEIQRADDALALLQAERGEIEAKVRERDESIQKITGAGRNSECPTCLRPLMDSYDSTLEKLRGELERYQREHRDGVMKRIQSALRSRKELMERFDRAKKASREAQGKSAAAARQREHLDARSGELEAKQQHLEVIDAGLGELESLRYDAEAHRTVTMRFQELETIHAECLRMEASVSRISGVAKSIGEARDGLALLKRQEDELAARQRGIPWSEEAFNAARDAVTAAEKARDSARDSLQALRDAAKDGGMRLANLGARLEDDADKRKKVATNKTMMDTLNRLDALFDEFKTAVLDRVRPSISQYASQLFGRITRGRYELITVDDDFNFRIMDEGATYPIQRFSGGEIDLANLCLRVAISRAIHELAGSASLGFMGFDEIFGSQDDDRRREIFNALQYLQGMFRQVFIISHINEIKEEFPQVLEITESPSGAQARWIRSDHGEAG